MMNLKHKFIFIFSVFIFTHSSGQDLPNRVKSESSVNKYLVSTDNDYKPISFGECFNQTYPKEVQDKLKTKRQVKYSLVHTYMIGNKKQEDVYFHLDGKYRVVGKLTSLQMDEVTNEIINRNGKLDSLTKSIELEMLKDSVK